jgi:hypothetical protein
MRRASALALSAWLAACASGGARTSGVAALGWSLGGEAHVFVTGDRFAAELYAELTARPPQQLRDSLARRRLVAISPPAGRRAATVFFPNGSATAALTLARFHTAGACGRPDLVTELVLAFPPASRRSTPPSHAVVVAVLDRTETDVNARAPSPPLRADAARELVIRVAQAAERALGGRRAAAPLGVVSLDRDRASDAGEVLPLPVAGAQRTPRYAVGFRVRFADPQGDTVLVTGIADADTAARGLRWIVRPTRGRLVRGMMSEGRNRQRYSLRGAVGPLVLVHEIAEVNARDSRAIAVRADNGRIIAAQPLALRCP